MSVPIPRELDVDLTSVPRHWMGGSAVATAIANGINLLFPHGERFFVRSVNHYLEDITDPELRAQVLAFFKQEGHHARAHDTFNEVLRRTGGGAESAESIASPGSAGARSTAGGGAESSIDEFLSRYRAISNWLEARLPAKLNLAGTAAAEHYTAILAHGAFTKGMLDATAPGMRELLAWHAAEEIEHKAVAFDVLQQIDPSYALRMAGLVYATVMLGAFWVWASRTLLRQEKLTWRELRRQIRAMRSMRDSQPIIKSVFLAGIRQYIRRDFHPRHNANEHLAKEWFAAHGMAFTEAA